MIQLTIIRHGQTVENATHLCQGQQQGKLSETGIQQAKKVAERLRDEPIDLFYSSDLQRTRDTSAAILVYHPELKLIPDPLLRERYMASWEGKPFPDRWHWDYLPDGAETNEDLLERANLFIEKIRKQHDGKHVVAVTHGGLIRALWTLITGKPVSAYFSWEEPKNTAVSRIELHDNGKHQILEMNNTDHLSEQTPGTSPVSG